jgi:YesN/AraC family two-component response regulator
MERKSILLVEDEAVVREMIRGALEREHRVLEASRYSEAVDHSGSQIDLALVDYALPDRDGFEVIEALRKAKPSLPVILMTAYGNESLAIRALRVGVSDYIRKPVSFAYLMKRLSEILGVNCGSHFRGDASTREEFIMDGIAAYIEDRYREDLSLAGLAQMACMNKFSFCRAFKNRFGLSFLSYLNTVRLRKAANLLEDPHLNVTGIATFVGYDNVAHFGRAFRAVYGMSPTEYRRSGKSGG